MNPSTEMQETTSSFKWEKKFGYSGQRTQECESEQNLSRDL